MNTLQFIDAMTGRLAWPLASIVLGLLFRKSLVQMLRRVRRLKWGEKEAELAELQETASDMQQAIKEAAEPLPEGHEEPVRRNRMERLARQAAAFGFHYGRRYDDAHSPPNVRIVWENGQPSLNYSAMEEVLRRKVEPVVRVSQVKFEAPPPPE